ncbi:divalent metal cation transporter [Mycolicibacterium mucogenicum]|uniref:NRAMP family divalent metal transporter n=1 Tax=Mycolicibacterium mucogenicum TaxID=56689 RepID=UPI00226A1871|nr:NRAMP family divalent metal transporter [Mycolicibacterium mucogenicum]MCX8556157.1 divalent metal cation transporter [Mycolicibacterium mucogenicum]
MALFARTPRPTGETSVRQRDSPSTAVLDTAHVGDIVGALGTIRTDETTTGRSRRQRLMMLLVVMGPGLIVMVGDNDAGGVATYAQAGQNYGTALMWTLALLIPVLYVNQEMVVRLGAVAGVGHARLIFARFGKFWGAFSVGDLFIVNALTIVTEFVGVSMALNYFGLPKAISVPLAAVLLFAVVAGGSFRRWERFIFALIAINIVIFPLAFIVHPSVSETAHGLIPSFPGGLNSTLLLLIVAIVGTTVAPWQLFFQQSNIVDKRLTPKWIRYERVDLWIGIVVVMVGAVAIMAAAAFGLGGSAAAGNFTDAGDVATQLGRHVSHTAGALFAILLLDASLIGANAVGLATTYALGDTMGKRHSLHWKVSEAPAFYLGYAALLAVAAAVSFSPDHVLGLLTQGVQALAGVLLPSATVFLVLLCNDKAVLGPWVNTMRQNIMAGVIVWALVLLSLALTAATFFPNLTAAQLEWGFGAGVAVGVLGGGVIAGATLRSRRQERKQDAVQVAAELGGLDPEQVEDLDEEPDDRKVRKALRSQERDSFRTPALETLDRPAWSPLRVAGMVALRGYLLVAVVLVGVKVAEAISG